jgi:phosphatidylserine/phosphatidylglycerophosphate/cardiolipin synthase-like enzyme
MSTPKVILLIGTLEPIGRTIIDALLSTSNNGTWRVRVLIDDPASLPAQELAAKGVELAIGSWFRPDFGQSS